MKGKGKVKGKVKQARNASGQKVAPGETELWFEYCGQDAEQANFPEAQCPLHVFCGV